MKKNFKLTLSTLGLAGVMIFLPCAAYAKISATNAIVSYGITYNKVSFEEVSSEKVPTPLLEKIERNKIESGFLSMTDNKNGVIYIAVLGGEKMSGGYSIKVKTVEDIEGKIKVTAEEQSPAEDAMVTQALTYPFTVIKASNITPSIMVVSDGGVEYKNLNKEEVKVPPVIGIEKTTGVLEVVNYVNQNVFITIKTQNGKTFSYYAAKGTVAEKSLKKFKLGQKILVKYILGTPINNAFPFALVTELPKAQKSGK